MTTPGQKRRDLKEEILKLDSEMRNKLQELTSIGLNIYRLINKYNELAESSAVDSRLAMIIGDGDDLNIGTYSDWGSKNASYFTDLPRGKFWFPSTRYC